MHPEICFTVRCCVIFKSGVLINLTALRWSAPTGRPWKNSGAPNCCKTGWEKGWERLGGASRAPFDGASIISHHQRCSEACQLPFGDTFFFTASEAPKPFCDPFCCILRLDLCNQRGPRSFLLHLRFAVLNSQRSSAFE